MDKHNVELTKSLVTGLLKSNYTRITTRAYMELGGTVELSHKLTKTALMVVQAAKFAEQMDYHRCYATILDIEGMEGGYHYTEIKKYLNELKEIYPTKSEAALLEPVNIDWGRAVVPKTAPKPKVEAAVDEYPETGDKGVSTSIITAGALVALGLLAIASTKGVK